MINVRITLQKARSKPSFVNVNVHHSIQESELIEELSCNDGMNVVKESGIISRANGKPTKLIRVKTEPTNQVLAAQRHVVQIDWWADILM